MQRLNRLLPISVALLTFLVFLPSLTNGFVNWDDYRNFIANPNYRGLGWDQLHWMWTTRFFNHYAPVTWMTLGLDYTIWGMDARGYHLTSLLFHTANAVLFYFLALALLGDAARRHLAAACAALFFAIHPLRAEPVAWASNRLEVVSTFFVLLALLAYIKRWYWRCLSCFTLAVLSKETAIALPAILLVLDYYPLRRLRGARVWLEKLPFVLVGMLLSLPAIQSTGVHGEAFAGLPARFAMAVYSFAFYVWKTAIPVKLAPFYPLTAHRVDFHGLPFQLSAVLLLLTLAAMVLFRRHFPALMAAGLVYFVTVLPVSGLFSDSESIAADRYSYLPCLAWALIAGACLQARKLFQITAVLIICIVSVLTWRQVQIWHDSEALWTHAIESEPSAMAFDMRGQARLDRSDLAGAIQDFHQAVGIDPASASAHNHLGGALLGLNDWETAVPEFQTALSIRPDMAGAQNGWGYALMMQRNYREAILHFQAALQIEPEFANARENLEQAKRLTLQSNP